MQPPTAIDATAADLAQDVLARRVRKRPVAVAVEFADQPGVLDTREGQVRYQTGDALLKGTFGERWPVSRHHFDHSYEPMPPTIAGKDGTYRKRPLDVLARRMDCPFTVSVGPAHDLLTGDTGDWLVQYAPDNFGVVSATAFDATYDFVDAA